MNKTKLKAAENYFLSKYPGGFSDPAMAEIVKKHKPEKMKKLSKESFSLDKFTDPQEIIDSMNKIISRSSMVSVFEKPKFRDFAKAMKDEEKAFLANGLKEFLHGNQELGFDQMKDLLTEYKLAKWTLLTICPVYYNPGFEVFIKPTTVKNIISYFEIQDLVYSPKPSYSFYEKYRKELNAMKSLADPKLRIDNAAYSGFLMMSMHPDF